MHRVDTSTAVATPPTLDPTATPGYFTKGSATGSPPATVPGQDWFNSVQEELCNIVTGLGGVLDTTKINRAQIRDLLVTALGNKAEIKANSYRVTGCDCKNNAALPNYIWDMDADVIILYRPSDGSVVVRTNPGAALTNNVTTAGPVANGRDQAGVFTATSWVHFYWIWNGTTLATLSSTVAPPTGPTLPAGYTHWAYATTVFFTAASELYRCRARGSSVYNDVFRTPLAAGTATVETAVSLVDFMPPNAIEARLKFGLSLNDNTTLTGNMILIRLVPGLDFQNVSVINQALGNENGLGETHLIPNVNQNLYYIWNSAHGNLTRNLTIKCNGYKVPNGDC